MHFDIDYAYEYCKKVALSHYENFPVGSLLIPKDKRKYIYSIYAFARYADDIADTNEFSKDDKLNRLNEFEIELDKSVKKEFSTLNEETKYIFIALSNTIIELNIPVQEFRDLLIAFRQDSVKQKYDNFNELLEYSKYSANPVGRLVLYVFGHDPGKEKECFEYSNKICTALQLTNFWQDVGVDLKMNRIYIPLNVMKVNGYDENLLKEKTENDNFRKCVKHLVDRTRSIFDEGRGIIKCVSGRLKLELKVTIAAGEEILNKIEAINYNVISTRVTLSNRDKIKLLGKVFWK